LFHLHVHYQLVLGEQFVKNYHLPLEALFFDSVRIDQGLKVPSPELELIVLSLRALLKYRDRDVIKDILNIRSPGLPAPILEEIRYLLAQASEEKLSTTLTELSDSIPVNVVREFLAVATTRPRTGRRLLSLRSQVRQALRPYRRHGRSRASLLYFREMWRRRKSLRLTASVGKMTLPGGGTTVALIGADGSGKSTMSQTLHKWLSWKLDVRTFYLGSKKPSRRSRLNYLLFRATRRSHRAVRRYAGETRLPARLMGLIRQTMLDFHALSIAYDRLGYYQAGCQAAETGAIVIFDRFPLKSPLDGPRIKTSTAEESTSLLTRVLSRIERRVYDRFTSPDLFMVLRVTPGVSLRRKPDHDPVAIIAKCKAIDEFLAQPTDTRVLAIDAVQPFEEVLDELKCRLWEAL
jgi:thymidylate kinase